MTSTYATEACGRLKRPISIHATAPCPAAMEDLRQYYDLGSVDAPNALLNPHGVPSDLSASRRAFTMRQRSPLASG